MLLTTTPLCYQQKAQQNCNCTSFIYEGVWRAYVPGDGLMLALKDIDGLTLALRDIDGLREIEGLDEVKPL